TVSFFVDTAAAIDQALPFLLPEEDCSSSLRSAQHVFDLFSKKIDWFGGLAHAEPRPEKPNEENSGQNCEKNFRRAGENPSKRSENADPASIRKRGIQSPMERIA